MHAAARQSAVVDVLEYIRNRTHVIKAGLAVGPPLLGHLEQNEETLAEALGQLIEETLKGWREKLNVEQADVANTHPLTLLQRDLKPRHPQLEAISLLWVYYLEHFETSQIAETYNRSVRRVQQKVEDGERELVALLEQRSSARLRAASSTPSVAPRVRRTRVQRAVRNEVLPNLQSIDARIGFMYGALEQDRFDQQIAETRARIAPALNPDGYHLLITLTRTANLRQAFNSRPLRTDLSAPLIEMLIESEIDPSAVRFFYDQLNEVQDRSESLLTALTDASKSSPRDPALADYHRRLVSLAMRVLENRSQMAYVAGLHVLHLFGADPSTNEQLALLRFMQPRELIDSVTMMELQERHLGVATDLMNERQGLLIEGEQALVQELGAYQGLDDVLLIRPTDRWNDVVVKAVTLRDLGRIEDAVAAFARYGELFAPTDPTAAHYAQTAQAFTRQLPALGAPGGVYVSKLVQGSPAAQAGLEAGDILIEIDGQPVQNMIDYMNATRHSADAAQTQLVYLRLEPADGQFVRAALAFQGGLLAGVMSI
jgi:hypothetical protein